MRMWMVPPTIMCRKHLLGEHVEHHMFVGTLNKGVSVAGYLRDNLLEPMALIDRHAALATEMIKRGYKHISELSMPRAVWTNLSFEERWTTIDRKSALAELVDRCPECRRRYEESLK